MAQSAIIASWEKFLHEAGIPDPDAETYAEKISDNRITDHLDLTRETLKEIGVTKVSVILAITKFCRQSADPTHPREPVPLHEEQRQPQLSKPPTTSAPHITAEMTHPEFRKLRIDWRVFKSLTALPTTQIAAHNCDTNVQTSIINSSDYFFTLSEDDIFKLLEKITTKRSNPSVHRIAFSNLTQSENEPVKDFVVRLKSHARDCEFACPNCNHDLVPTNVMDQLVRGLHNSTLQTDILAKSETLKVLADVVKHAESFEAALHDQSKLQHPSDVMSARTTDYKRMSQERLTDNWNNRQPPKSSNQLPTPPTRSDGQNGQQPYKSQQQKGGHFERRRTCAGCGAATHNDRPKDCPAWGKSCHNCNRPNHFYSVCRQPKRDSASAIIAHVRYNQHNDSVTSAHPNEDIQFIPAKMTPIIAGSHLAARTAQVFPDSGADICLAGTRHLNMLGVEAEHLTPCRKNVTTAGGSTLTCKGWFQCEFEIGNNTTCQPVYICEKVDRIYFGRQGCTEVKILPETFPFPMEKPSDVSSVEATPPPRPETIPFRAVEENVPKLKAYLVEKFGDTVFNRSTPFWMMNCQPAHIHLKEDAKPYAIHNPFSIPIHWREEAK